MLKRQPSLLPIKTLLLSGGLMSTLMACTPTDFRPEAIQDISIKQGSTAKFKTKVERDEGSKGPITVSLNNLPEGVTAAAATIPEGQTEAEVTLTATATAKLTPPTAATTTEAPTAETTTATGEGAADSTRPVVVFTTEKKTHEQPVSLTVRALSGSLDKSFGKNGVMQTKLGIYRNRDHANALAQEDGKILVGGQKKNHFALVRLAANGQLDTSFGQQGTVEAAGVAGTIEKLLVTEDGTILAVGSDGYEGSGLMLARFTSNGKLDSSFGKNGVVNFKFSGFDLHSVSDALLQSDGKVVLVGRIGNQMGGSGGITDGKSLLARFMPDGAIDRSFGSGGRIIGAPQEFGRAVDVEPGLNDTLLVVGSTYNRFGDNWGSNVFYLARYLSDGSADNTFGSNGFVTYTQRPLSDSDNEADVYGVGLSVMPNGNVLTVANISTTNYDTFDTRSRVRVAQYLPDGARDTEFGEAGEQVFDFGYSASASDLVEADDGYFLTALVSPEESSYPAPSLVKLTKAGVVDEAFNFDGRVGIGTLDNPLNPVVLKSGQVFSGTTLSPFFQDYDDNDDAAKINVELVRINP